MAQTVFGGGGNGLSGQPYRDPVDGRVHYADGSVGPATAGWQGDDGNWVYATGNNVRDEIFRAQGMTPPGQTGGPSYATDNKGPYQVPAQTMPNASGVADISGYTAGMNPYLQQQGDALVQQNTQNLQRNVLPRIASNSLASGSYGSSRRGVIESNALSDLNTANANALTSLYGQGYNNALQYDLGRRNTDLGYYNAANSYDLGRRNNDLGYFNGANSYNQAMGNLGLGYAQLDRQINNDNLSWAQQGYNNNLGLWNQLQGNNQTGINAGTNIQNTPMNYWSQFGNQYNSIGQGYGTQTQSGGGNPIMGALGGAQLGSQVASWWNGGGSGTGMTGSNAPASSYNIGSFDYGIGSGGGGLGLKY